MRWLSLLLFTVCVSYLYGKETKSPTKKHQNKKKGRDIFHVSSIKNIHTIPRVRAKSYKELHRKLKHKHYGRLHPKYHDVSGQRKSVVIHGTQLYQKTHDDNFLQRLVDPRAIAVMRMLVKRGEVFAGRPDDSSKKNNARSIISHYVDPEKFGEILMKNSKEDSQKRMDIDINVTGKRTERVDPSKLGLAILKLMFGENANLVIQKSPAGVKVDEVKEMKARENKERQLLARKHELFDRKRQTLNDLIRQQDVIKQKGMQEKIGNYKQKLAPITSPTTQFDTDMGSNFMKAVTNLHSALEQVQTEKKENSPVLENFHKTLPNVAKKSANSSTRNQLSEQINDLLRRLKPFGQKRIFEKRPKALPQKQLIRDNSAVSVTVGDKPLLSSPAPVFTTAKSVTPNENLVQMSNAVSPPKRDKSEMTKDISSVLEYLDNEDKGKSKALKTRSNKSPKSTSAQEMAKQIDRVQESVKSMMHIAQSMENAAKEIAAKIKATPKPSTKKPVPKTLAPDRKSWVLLKLPKAQADTILPFTSNDMISQIPYDENPFNKEVIGVKPTNFPVQQTGRENQAHMNNADQTKLRLADSIQNLIAALRSSLKTVTQENTGQTPENTGRSQENVISNSEIHESAHDLLNMNDKPTEIKNTGLETMRKLFTEENDQDVNRIKVVHASDLREYKEDLETFAQRGLQAHNRFRIMHHSKPLRWSDELATQAEKLAYDMAMKGKVARSEVAEVLGYGENVARVSHVAFNNAGVEATKLWYNQLSNYSFNDPRLNPYTDAFTQVVWSETTQIGMGCAKDMQTNDLYVVALYKPHGNIVKNLRHDVLNKGRPVDIYSTIFKRNEMLLKRMRNRNWKKSSTITKMT